VSTGVPQPTTILWFIGDDTIMESSDKYTIRGDQLIIHNVSFNDVNIQYGCVAQNFANGLQQNDSLSEFYSACSKPIYIYCM